MRVLSCYGDRGEEFLAECQAHQRLSRLFPGAEAALEYAREHNGKLHRGRAPILIRRALASGGPDPAAGPPHATRGDSK